MTIGQRVWRLAAALGLSCESVSVEQVREDGCWWIFTKSGDQPLPRTRGCYTVLEALDAAEAWLAPEIDAVDVNR